MPHATVRRFLAGAMALSILAVACVLPQDAAGEERRAVGRVLLVDSYHQGYAWSDGIKAVVTELLAAADVELRVVYMDGKRQGGREAQEAAGARVMREVAAYGPDLVIASDDSAQKYFVVPYLLGTDLPVVFCGVNWDASVYGYPAANVTGMVEVDAVPTLMDHLRRFAAGDRVALISDDSLSEHRTANFYNQEFFGGNLRTWFFSGMEEFKAAFLAAQQEADMLLVMNNAAVADWDNEAAGVFLVENTRVPTGSVNRHMAEYVIYTILKSPEEQGHWAAETALAILGGASPSSIPLARNQGAGLVVNLKLAEAAGIVIPMSTLRAATQVIGQESVNGDGETSP